MDPLPSSHKAINDKNLDNFDADPQVKKKSLHIQIFGCMPFNHWLHYKILVEMYLEFRAHTSCKCDKTKSDER